MPATDPLWYKDAVIYQVHVRAFCDSTGDGIGDFRGLAGKLAYIQRPRRLVRLAAAVLSVAPARRRLRHRALRRRASRATARSRTSEPSSARRTTHGLQVITELVINHTSDQHPWFQAARRAPAGSAKRDFYVWSDTTHRYDGARIIFSDTETSNWAWDPVADAYYWHRFFHHQPDLNFDNPRVAPGSDQGHAVLAGHGRRRHAAGRRALPDRTRRHELREPARDARGAERACAARIDQLQPPHAAGRSEPVAGRRPRLFRRRRRMPHGVPLPADAAHLHGAASRKTAIRSSTSSRRRPTCPRPASGRSSCGTTTS